MSNPVVESVGFLVEDTLLVRDLAIIGSLAVITAVALSRLHLPVVAGFLVAGAVFGPDGIGLISDAGEIRAFADIGVVLLLFGIGLEFSLERLRYIWRSVVLGGAFQVGLTAAAVFVVMLLIGDTVQRALLFSFVIALSSTAVVLRALTDRGEIDAPPRPVHRRRAHFPGPAGRAAGAADPGARGRKRR